MYTLIPYHRNEIEVSNMENMDWSYWRIFSIGLCAPLVVSVVLITISYLITGQGLFFLLTSTCFWPLVAFAFAIYSYTYESDELATGALASGLLGVMIGIYILYMAVSGWGEGMSAFSQ